MQVNIKDLIDDAQCYDTVRELRWPEGRVTKLFSYFVVGQAWVLIDQVGPWPLFHVRIGLTFQYLHDLCS